MMIPYLVRVSEAHRSSASSDEPTLEDPLPWPAMGVDGQTFETMITEVGQETTDDA